MREFLTKTHNKKFHFSLMARISHSIGAHAPISHFWLEFLTLSPHAPISHSWDPISHFVGTHAPISHFWDRISHFSSEFLTFHWHHGVPMCRRAGVPQTRSQHHVLGVGVGLRKQRHG
jgi:hypothetical protein